MSMKRKKEGSKEQWKKEDKTKTLTAIEHEEKESSSQKRRTQRTLGKEDTKDADSDGDE